jgi:hypothetical protein
MIIIGNFRHSLEFEQALAGLEQNGIPHNQILVVFLESEPQDPLQCKKLSTDVQTKKVEV